MIDITLIINELKKEFPCFSSEANFQFHFAWKTKEIYPDCAIDLERASFINDNDKSSYIDLLITYKNIKYPIEFKYLTSEINYLDFNLKEQSAKDIRSYDVIKDIERIENYCLKNKLNKGYVILVTNTKSYWNTFSSAKKSNYYEFNLGEGRTLQGELKWGPNTGIGTKKGRESSLNLRNKYNISWKEYSDLKKDKNIKNGNFKYLIFEISFSSEKNELYSTFTKEKQEKLFCYLNNIKKNKINLTLDKICAIIESPLSKSAYTHIEYWSDRTRDLALNSWIKAGFFAKLDLKNQSVEFYKKNLYQNQK